MVYHVECTLDLTTFQAMIQGNDDIAKLYAQNAAQ
jgi:hypothetical protein